ncbi:SDR family NAD(P)-dependent oxidoreductase, partial [bacterium]|nr:SDR family NAD(P)-dependent oxidoreductase [bacterium]
MENQVALISGASTGIGRAIAKGFAREGAKLAIIARSTDKLEKLAEEIRAEGGTVTPITCDISDEAQVKAAVKKTMDEYGRIDALVTTASLLVTSPVIDSTVEDWDRLFATNSRGTFLICRELLPIMRSQGRGRIVIYSSGAAWGYKLNEAIYSA